MEYYQYNETEIVKGAGSAIIIIMTVNTAYHYTATPKVMKIFSHPQTRNQSQVVQNDKLSRENVETKIFVGGKGTFSHFLEKKLKKI